MFDALRIYSVKSQSHGQPYMRDDDGWLHMYGFLFSFDEQIDFLLDIFFPSA
jgi:hypothetical protein